MVLGELGNKITAALNKVDGSVVLNETSISEMIKEISNALVAADVNVKIVFNLREALKARTRLDVQPVGINKRKFVKKVC